MYVIHLDEFTYFFNHSTAIKIYSYVQISCSNKKLGNYFINCRDSYFPTSHILVSSSAFEMRHILFGPSRSSELWGFGNVVMSQSQVIKGLIIVNSPHLCHQFLQSTKMSVVTGQSFRTGTHGVSLNLFSCIKCQMFSVSFDQITVGLECRTIYTWQEKFSSDILALHYAVLVAVVWFYK